MLAAALQACPTPAAAAYLTGRVFSAGLERLEVGHESSLFAHPQAKKLAERWNAALPQLVRYLAGAAHPTEARRAPPRRRTA
jgi:hypothetical protein